ncbi:MAG: secondary thiamine-phosphate synthase enzyme YjbQ [Planctomycetes bacterium]|nr:secondary thiamine-phosphate synthase enzyme YjbQ [Planctomycetota bacterium]
MASIFQDTLQVRTSGRGFLEISEPAQHFVAGTPAQTGVLTVFIHHTSASLIICENADPQVLSDLEEWMQRAIPDGDPMFGHTAEGPDDMPAHIRSVLTATSLSLPVTHGRISAGTWQGLYLYEHRAAPHTRHVSLTLVGE